jgi:hypothetical protein
VTIVLLSWHAVESVRISPHYLAYVNQLAGGPSNGYKHLADSSLDWGQDLPALKQWLDRQGLQPQGAPRVYLSYFGTGRPEYYGIDATQLWGFLNVVAPRPWTATLEAEYQRHLSNVKALGNTGEGTEARTQLLRRTGEDFWWQTFRRFDELRVGRLAAFLRHREPDAEVGYSILIYRLTAADVMRALEGTAPTETSR